MAIASSFAGTIKPYFTACYRAHMMHHGDQFDLWDPAAVQFEWPQIITAVTNGTMPARVAGGCLGHHHENAIPERF